MIPLIAAAAWAAAPDLYAGCRLTLVEPTVGLICPKNVAFLTFTAQDSPMGALQLGMAVLGADTAVVVEIPRPAGQPLQVLQTGSEMMGGFFKAAAVERKPGIVQFLACRGPEETCAAMLVDVADNGLPDLRPSHAPWVDPEPFPGRKLDVPRGCFPTGDAAHPSFVCGLDTLGGSVVAGGAALTPEEMLAATAAERKKHADADGTPLVQTPVTCAIDGAPAACALWTRPPHSPLDAPFDVVGYARRGDQVLLASCRWAGDAAQPPDFCAQLLTWEAPKPAP